MKLLVIGSTGFIGQHCVKYFSSAGYEVFEADILPAPEKKNYCHLNYFQPDFNEIFSRQGMDICINASGSANVGFSFEQPDLDFMLNVTNVQKILTSILTFCPKCKFINFSSAAVYGNPASLPVKEDMPVLPLSPYGQHKAISEELLRSYHQYFGLHTCNLRIFSAYGIGLRKQLFWDLYKKTLQGNIVTMFGTGDESRDFIYIDDLVSIIDMIIRLGDFSGSIYNIASGKETTIRHVTEFFLENFAPQSKLIFSGQKKLGDPDNWVADINRIRSLGYVTVTPVQEGIKKYIQWLQESA